VELAVDAVAAEEGGAAADLGDAAVFEGDDLVRVLLLLPGSTLASYAARLKPSVNSMPAQGGTVAST
jgi:hypothetical protein